MSTKKTTTIKTLTALAKALDCSTSQTSRYIRRKDWRFATRGPWTLKDVAAIQRWRADNLKAGAPERPRPGESEATRHLRHERLDAEVRKLRAQADTVELERDERAGKLVPIADVIAEWSRIGQQMRTAFGNLGSSILPVALARGMPMQAAAEFQSIVQQQVDAVLRVAASDGQQEAGDTGTGTSEPAQPEEARP